MSVLKTLTENIVKRNLQRDGAALLNKWEKTGLLEGLSDDYQRNSLAVLLENQAKELLREATTMAGGDVEGYAAVAFPIVRRVFGGLIANDLVSVQPMSLPSGLVFFMDFTKHAPESRNSTTDTRDGTFTKAGDAANAVAGNDTTQSIYGGGAVGSGILGGIDPSQGGVYNLQQGHTAARGATSALQAEVIAASAEITLSGAALTELQQRMLGFDADLLGRSDSSVVQVFRIVVADNLGADAVLGLNAGAAGNPIPDDGAGGFTRCMGYGDSVLEGGTLARTTQRGGLSHINLTEDDSSALGSDGGGNLNNDCVVIRRLTRIVQESAAGLSEPGITQAAAADVRYLEFVVSSATAQGIAAGGNVGTDLAVEFAKMDNAAQGNTIATVLGAAAWEMEDSTDLPEIDIAVDSAAITAATRKLKARWTPELAQDLNAYHNLDAEVELTGVLSEHIALEIDQEILGDLIKGGTADTFFWSRRPGLFVNRNTGADITSAAAPPDFTGTVSEWYETLIETINDVSASIHRKTLRGGANFLVCGPEVANILEFTSGFRASVTHDDDKGTVGAVSAGSINKKWDLIIDPYFPRNVILVGRKGGSFLESGYVYAPYVPLQVTPTIFDPDDFTPRKAVMTRYGKRMVNPDMYGLVLVRDLQG